MTSKCGDAPAFELPARRSRVDFAVKNTFIEVDDSFSEDEDFEPACKATARQRQVSAPVFSLASRLQADEEDRKRREDDLNSSTTGSTAGETETEPHQQATDVESEPQQQQQQQQQQQDHEQQTMSWNPAAVPFDGQGFVGSCAGDAADSQWALVWAAPMVMPMPQEAPLNWANESEGLEPVLMPGHFGGYGVESASGYEVEPAAGHEVEPVPEVPSPPRPKEWADVTTLMVRNLPNRYTQQMLLEEICDAGFAGNFDFLYLPVDPETNANKGYAFINMTDPEQAWRFKTAFEDKKMARFNSSKFVMVSPAALQGLEANHAHYSTTRCSRGDPATRPLFLRELAPSRGGARSRGSRRGGQRHRDKGRSLVDVAAQKMHEEQSRKQQPQPAAAPAPAGCGETQFCPYCGGRVQSSWRFCQYCGKACPKHGSS